MVLVWMFLHWSEPGGGHFSIRSNNDGDESASALDEPVGVFRTDADSEHVFLPPPPPPPPLPDTHMLVSEAHSSKEDSTEAVVTRAPPPAAWPADVPTVAGRLNRHVFADTCGGKVASGKKSPKFPHSPDQRDTVNEFQVFALRVFV